MTEFETNIVLMLRGMVHEQIQMSMDQMASAILDKWADDSASASHGRAIRKFVMDAIEERVGYAMDDFASQQPPDGTFTTESEVSDMIANALDNFSPDLDTREMRDCIDDRISERMESGDWSEQMEDALASAIRNSEHMDDVLGAKIDRWFRNNASIRPDEMAALADRVETIASSDEWLRERLNSLGLSLKIQLCVKGAGE